MKTVFANRGSWRPIKEWRTGLLWLLWLGAVTAGQGASPRWTGAVNGYWSEPNNWDPAGVPANGDLLVFSRSDDQHHTMTNDLVNLSVRGVRFGIATLNEQNHHNYHVYGNSLRLTGGLTDDGRLKSEPDGDNEVTIHCPLVFQDGGEAGVFPNYSTLFGSTDSLRLNGPITVEAGILTLSPYAYDGLVGQNNVGHIFVSGAISGPGRVRAEADGGFVHFVGPLNNTFTGGLFLDTSRGGRVIFEKTAGFVVTNLMAVDNQSTGRVEVIHPNQLGPATVLRVTSRARFELTGGTLNIGSLVMSNQTTGGVAPVVDTGSATLGLFGSIFTSVRTNGLVPVIRGQLSLMAGDHLINVSAPQYEGLSIEAQIIGPGGFTKTGNAALLLPGNNSFLGQVMVNDGILDVRHAQALGGTGGGTTLGAGGLLLRNVNIAGEGLVAAGVGTVGDLPGSVLTSVGLSSWAGSVVLNTNLVVNGDLAFTGPISGSGGLGCFGGGTIRLGGTGLNFFTGPTLVRCPLLELDKPFGFRAYSGPLIVGGGPGGLAEVRWLNSYQNLNTPLTLYGNGVVNLNNQVENFGPVTFNGGAIQTGTGFFVAESSLTVNPAASIATVDGNLSLGINPATFIVGNGPAEPDLRVNAIISGASIIKQGPGTLVFAAPNTFSGALFVQEGILQAENSAAFGTTGGNTIVYSNATIRLAGVDGLTEAFHLEGTGLGGTNGALQITVGGTMTGNIFLIGPSTINASSGGLAIDSIVSGTGPLTKTGAGNLYLGGVSGGAGNNTYSGDTIVSAGTLYLSKNQGVMAVPGNLIVGNGATVPATARFNRSGMMNASAIITVNANGLLDLNGNNQTLPRLNLNDGGDVQTGAGTLGFTAGGMVSVGTLNAGGLGLRRGASISGNIALPVLDYLTFDIVPYGAAPFPGEGFELNIPAVIRNAGNIIKTGAGALRLGGANTFNDSPPNFAGDVFVNGGTLIAAHATALGGTAGWTFVNNGGALAMLEGVTITGENLFLDTTRSPALHSIAGDNIWNGPISLTRDSTIAASRDWSLQLNGVVSGAGSLTKIGEGELTLGGGANNTHVGNTFVHDGTLVLFKSPFLQAVPHDLIIGSGPATAPATLVRYLSHDPVWNRITVNANGLLDLNGFNEASGDLTLNGGGDVQTGTGTYFLGTSANLIVNPGTANNPATISGRLGLFPGLHQFTVNNGVTALGQFDLNIPATVFQNTTAAGFIKGGNGRMRLAGTNTYTGLSYLSSGLLQVDGVQPQSTVEMDHETSLRGSGTVGHILFNGGALVVAPGNSAGTLTCSNLDASGGNGRLEMELNGHPTSYDQIVARGLVDLRGLALKASLNFVSSTGQQFTLIHNDGSDAVTGTFNGLPQNAPLTIGDESFVISYTGGTGNDVVLTRTPTPPRPVLTIEAFSPASVRLKWPTNFTGYTLQFSTNLSATNWSTATPSPVSTGTNRVVTNATASSPRFYRLMK